MTRRLGDLAGLTFAGRRGRAGATAPTERRGNPLERGDDPVERAPEAPAPDEPTRPAGQQDRRLLAVLLTVGATAFAAAIRLRLHGSPAGDEPAYLVLSQTMQKYHSLDVMKDYLHGDYRAFYHGYLEPHVVRAANGRLEPLHNFGGPLLWLVPFVVAGRLGADAFIGLVSLLLIGNLYAFLREQGINTWYAFTVTALTAIGSPIYIYASMAFVEPIGALLVLYAVRVLLGPRLTTGRVLVASTGLAYLPWVHTRLLMFTVILGGLLVLRRYRESGWAQPSGYLPVLVPILGSLVVTEVYNLVAWGTLNPASNMSNAGNGPFQVPLPTGLLGTLFDRQVGLITNFPLFVLVLPGFLLAIRSRERWQLTVLLATMVPYLVLICTFQAWWAGYSPPARYIDVIVPLLVYYVAVALQRIDSTLLTCAAIVLGIASYALALASDLVPRDRFAAPGNHNKAMDRLSQLFGVHFVHHIPTAFASGQRPLFLAWFAATVAVGAVLWLAGMRKRGWKLRAIHRLRGVPE
ncbi:MAG TPA: hypothetical protein VJT31_00135 [Rugosimonospora sp.]|nr:hypothetical protein [Rugosimonospora sp.]